MLGSILLGRQRGATTVYKKPSIVFGNQPVSVLRSLDNVWFDSSDVMVNASG